MTSFRGWLLASCLGLGLVASNAGCAADGEDAATSQDAELVATCGLDPTSPASPRRLLDKPMKDEDDAEQRFRCLSDELTRQHDGRAPFATLYSAITTAMRDAIRAGRFEDSAWLGRYLTTFAELYRVAFVDYVDGRREQVPGAWRIAFDAAKENRVLVVQALSLGVNAHVDRDLSHALVIVGIGDDHETRELRHRDHNKVNDILHENVSAGLARLADLYAPGYGEAPEVVMNLLSQTYFGAVATGRFKAWVDAVALADSPRLLRPAIELEIEVSSKIIGEAIMAPMLAPGLIDKLHDLEDGQSTAR